MDIYYGQDGSPVSKEIKQVFKDYLDPGDIRFNKKKNDYLFDTVGLIVGQSERLIIFPKHTFDENLLNTSQIELERILKAEKLLFQVINMYSRKKTLQVDRVLGSGIKFGSIDYPFVEFLEIYDYFEKYGIFFEKKRRIKQGENGSYAWKKIISKSNVYFNGNNIIYTPLYSKINYKQLSYISSAMTYVINSTIDNFTFLFDLKKAPVLYQSESEFSSPVFVINKLAAEATRIHKDDEKQLVRSLIAFFEFKKRERSSGMHVKVNYFNNVWQRMVHLYLNRHYERIDMNNEIVISPNFHRNNNPRDEFFSVKNLSVDISSHLFEVQFDHYHLDNSVQLIFDSKYYDEDTDLNYKQLAYHEMLTKNYRDSAINTYSALIFPGNKQQKLHFALNPVLYLIDSQGNEKYHGESTRIHSLFLDVITLMEDYLKFEIQ